MENYESEIRPALARWMGIELEHNVECASGSVVRLKKILASLPDPLHNPADAWALMVALMNITNGHMSLGGDECGEWELSITLPGFPARYFYSDKSTPSEALVLAAWQVVREREGR